MGQQLPLGQSMISQTSNASTDSYSNKNNDVDFYKILNGDEKRTTIMIRNIPNKFKQMNLLEMINVNHFQQYDYFYLPMDLKVKIIEVV